MENLIKADEEKIFTDKIQQALQVSELKAAAMLTQLNKKEKIQAILSSGEDWLLNPNGESDPIWETTCREIAELLVEAT